MAQINVLNLTFCYDGSYDNVFDNVSFQIDTDWKLGFVGRNGRGKTTFLKLLNGEFEYQGKISSPCKFDYFPYEIPDKTLSSYDIAESKIENYESWIFDRELNLLECSEDCRWRPFDSLSGGEQTKIMLAILFLCNNNFLLIDEPTNHLDIEGRKAVSKYLHRKKGYILVSHDRAFLDGCVDHILSINKKDIVVQSGNFSTWVANKELLDNFEYEKNEKLKGEIDRLKEAARKKSNWSFSAEDKKKGASDKGFMGAKAARQMKTAKIIERRREKAIDEKATLLQNVEVADDLAIFPLNHQSDTLVTVTDLSLNYGNENVFFGMNFQIKKGDRIAVVGKNGSGKSSIFKVLTGEKLPSTGKIQLANGLIISYLPQDFSFLVGTPRDFAQDHALDARIFMGILFRLDFARQLFDRDMATFSHGQKKKILLAKSLSENAHLYIWDEPLNYVDILSRIQIENLIINHSPTLLFVEHDEMFSKKIATKTINL